MVNQREVKRFYRHKRIRQKVSGTSQRPRVCVHRSLNNLQAQAIDDIAGKIIFALSTLDKNVRSKAKSGGNVQAAVVLGEAFAVKALEKGIKKISFDRGGYMYHGRIKAFADAARKGGLEF
ncbi:MAG: 50S ribosomal protein L18 [Candidatus Omnitrophota bacterium]